MEFQFHIPTKILFGNAKRKELSSFTKGKRVYIVTDAYQAEHGCAKEIMNLTESIQMGIFSQVEPNPSCDTVDKAVAAAREFGAEVVIGLGGGSCIDVAKIVAALVTNEGKIRDYIKGKVFSNPRVGLIAIPTTAGTGSEVTNVGVFTDNETHIKQPMVHSILWCDVALVDPQLTVSLPGAATASTGLDALCHAIEAYWAISCNPLSDALGMQAVKLVLEYLKGAYDHPSDEKAREGMALASLLAGVAFSQTRTTALHAISFPLTSLFGLPHGFACAITLVPFIRHCNKAVKEKLTRLAIFCGFRSTEDLAKVVSELMSSVKAPVRLSEIGITASDLPRIAEISMSAKIMQNTPGGVEKEELDQILKELF